MILWLRQRRNRRLRVDFWECLGKQLLLVLGDCPINADVDFSGGSGKQEDAIELYIRAANAYKMGKHWVQAGGAFYQAAKLQQALKNRHDAATSLVESANCHKKVGRRRGTVS